jgi:hypothetical protein
MLPNPLLALDCDRAAVIDGNADACGHSSTDIFEGDIVAPNSPQCRRQITRTGCVLRLSPLARRRPVSSSLISFPETTLPARGTPA